METFNFQKLRVYQESRKMVKDIYLLLRKYPNNEQYAICDQMRRSAVSVPSNIAEGMSRTSKKEQIHFLEISYGSLMELFCQLEISKDINYISELDFSLLEKEILVIAKQLSGLRSSIQKTTLNNKP
ncbi:MAG: four helix bundle protein [Bacteroidaceae bacterium]|nr:four helix bundle protein [Bacteroidaceae bacterium]MEA5099169.1 four helix bundle protein [Bacteroidales bacterium]